MERNQNKKEKTKREIMKMIAKNLSSDKKSKITLYLDYLTKDQYSP